MVVTSIADKMTKTSLKSLVLENVSPIGQKLQSCLIKSIGPKSRKLERLLIGEFAGRSAETRKAVFDLILQVAKRGLKHLKELKLYNLGMAAEEGQELLAQLLTLNVDTLKVLDLHQNPTWWVNWSSNDMLKTLLLAQSQLRNVDLGRNQVLPYHEIIQLEQLSFPVKQQLICQYNRMVRQAESANSVLTFDHNFGALRFNNIDILTKYEPLRWSWDSVNYFLEWKLGSGKIRAIDFQWLKCPTATLNDLLDFCVENIDEGQGLRSLSLVEFPA